MSCAHLYRRDISSKRSPCEITMSFYDYCADSEHEYDETDAVVLDSFHGERRWSV